MATETTRAPRQGPPKFANNIVAFLLRSPLHGPFSGAIMLLTFSGRKSGKQYTIPVGYTREGNVVDTFTDHIWWKNLRDGAPVTVVIRGKTYQGRAEAIPDDREAIAAGLVKLASQHRGAARAYAITFDASSKPEHASALESARRFVMVRITLE
jgi:hypothetical protein